LAPVAGARSSASAPPARSRPILVAQGRVAHLMASPVVWHRAEVPEAQRDASSDRMGSSSGRESTSVGAHQEPDVPLLGSGCIMPEMPGPRSERQSLEEELAELPGQLAGYRRELAATLAEDKIRWEWLEWQIRRVQKRLTEVERRLAGS
jgi:hypothetical protein